MGSAILLFWIFKVFAWSAPDGQNLENPKKPPKKNCRPHVHRVRQEPQWGLQFCFFVSCRFSRFLHGLLQMARTSEIQKKNKKQNCRPHVHKIRQEPQWGLQFCFLFFLIFEVFAWSVPDGQNLENPKNTKKNKTSDHISTESDKSPNGVCSFVFCFFVFSRFLHGLLQMARTSKIKKK